MKFKFLILTYNKISYLKRIYDSLISASVQPVDIYIIDNGSLRENYEKIQKITKNIIRIESNQGFSKALNIGLKNTFKAADFVCFFSNDTFVDKDFYLKLKNYIKNLKIDNMYGFQSLYARNKKTEYYYGEIDYRNEKLKYVREPIISNEKIIKLNKDCYIPGAAFLMGRKFFEKFKGFNEEYFIFFEDVDLSRRAEGNLYIIPEIKFYHYRGITTGDNKKYTSDYFKINKDRFFCRRVDTKNVIITNNY